MLHDEKLATKQSLDEDNGLSRSFLYFVAVGKMHYELLSI